MSVLGSYSLEDFLLFSAETYLRQIELVNGQLWPWHAVALAAGLGLALVAFRPRAWLVRAGFVVLGVVWACVGWFFLWQVYSQINWAVVYVLPLFAFQAVLLIVLGVFGGRLALPQRSVVLAALIGFGVFVYPLVVLAVRYFAGVSPEQRLGQAEVFGAVPDPTVLVTLAFAGLLSGWRRWLLSVVPVIWCSLSAIVLFGLGDPTWVVVVLFAGASLAVGWGRGGL